METNDAPTISIINGRVIDPANGFDATSDVHVCGGKIAAIGTPPKGFKATRIIDAGKKIVCPGLIDLCARLREPGQEHKATIATETAAAASAGITTLCCPPDTDPVIDTPAVAELIRRRAYQSGLARVIPMGALTQGLQGKALSEMGALKQAGCCVLSNAYHPLDSTLVAKHAIEYARTFGLTCFLHPQDASLANQGCAHDGAVATRMGLPGIPVAAETVALAQALALVEQSRAPIHFRGLSSGLATRMLREARKNRLPVSADVSAHQLHLTEMDLESYNSNCHVAPPLRSLSDRDALREGVADGTIGAICSDHQPHEAEAKNAPFPATAPGISGLETLLPLTLRLVTEKVLTLNQALACLTVGPATILGLELGRLDVGKTADICIFETENNWHLETKEMLSAGRNTPFSGWELSGRATHTLLAGRFVFVRGPQ